MSEKIFDWIQSEQLVRITTVHLKAGRSVVYGRILQYSAENKRLLVYDDDQKMLHHLSFQEVDDIKPAL